jgi:uncharacterized protein YbaP (TraB family)
MKILKKILVTVTAFVGIAAFAQNQKSLLWKISGNGLKEPSYLYGTIHITCDATLDKPTLEALKQTAQLYLELDMDDDSMQMKMMQGMMMKNGATMKSLASDEDYKILDAYLTEKLGMGIAMFNTIKPAMISTLLLPSLMDCPMQSVETELMKITKAEDEEVFGLETVEDQMAVFDAIPYQVQMDELVKSAKDKFTADKKELDKMYAIYKTKDVDAMQKMTMESDNKITADFQDTLLNNRNANWIPKIESIAKQKPTFFGVGAGHLGGEKGVIALLRKKGYKVEAVLQ